MAGVYKTLCQDDKISEDKTVLKQMEVGCVVWKKNIASLLIDTLPTLIALQ